MKLGFPVTTNFWVCGEEKDSRGFQVKDFYVCSDTTNFWAQRKKSLLNEKAKGFGLQRKKKANGRRVRFRFAKRRELFVFILFLTNLIC
jgi:hypothetical protein